MKDKINDALDSALRHARKLPGVSKGKLPEWDGKCESYLNFKTAMSDLLVFDSEYLGLSTLKAQIVGKNKTYILSLLLNVQRVKEAWLALDRE